MPGKTCLRFLIDTNAGIADLKTKDNMCRRLADPRNRDYDFALAREFDRIADEIIDDLAQSTGIAAQGAMGTSE